MRLTKVVSILMVMFLSFFLFNCEDKDPSMFIDRLGNAYKTLNSKKFDKFMKHWSEDVQGDSENFKNYNDIFNFYRQYALNNDVLGIDVEFYSAKRDGEFVVADYKETINIIKDKKRVPLERVLRVWVKPLNSKFKVYKVKLLKIPDGAGKPLFEN